MFELFYMGGTLFMGILTTILLIILAFSVYQAIRILNHNLGDEEKEKHHLSYIKSLGLFALIFGILGQFLGLYSAFEYIEQVGSVSQDILAGGLKVSSITSMYGLIIFIISYLIWFGLDRWRATSS